MSNWLTRKLVWRLGLPARLARQRKQVKMGCLPERLRGKTLATLTRLCWQMFCNQTHTETTRRVLDYSVSAYGLEAIDFLFQEIFVDLEYFFETDTTRPFILDCGSNIGMSILFFKALYPDATVIGFEPADDSFALLKRNVESNQLKDVSIHKAALGSTPGKVTFFQEVEAGAFVASTDSRRATGRSTTVDQVRLSDFIDRDVDFLKLDVEGAEASVLNDLVSSGLIRKVRQMAIEYHHHLSPGDDRLSGFLAILEQNGFGYLVKANFVPQKGCGQFQDFLIYAYRKDAKSNSLGREKAATGLQPGLAQSSVR